MKIAHGTSHHQQLNLPVNSLTKMNAPEAEPTSIVAFAEKALGWTLEDKQQELLLVMFYGITVRWTPSVGQKNRRCCYQLA